MDRAHEVGAGDVQNLGAAFERRLGQSFGGGLDGLYASSRAEGEVGQIEAGGLEARTEGAVPEKDALVKSVKELPLHGLSVPVGRVGPGTP